MDSGFDTCDRLFTTYLRVPFSISNRPFAGRGWGKLLIMDALHRSLAASRATASFAVVVDAIDDAAVRFYQRFDFQPFPDSSTKLFRTMTNIDKAFGSI